MGNSFTDIHLLHKSLWGVGAFLTIQNNYITPLSRKQVYYMSHYMYEIKLSSLTLAVRTNG